MPPLDLAAILPTLLPLAIEWAEARAHEAAIDGLALDSAGQGIARRVGVKEPQLIRVMIMDELPMPTHPGLRQAALEAGLLGPLGVGLTLGYAVFIRRGHDTVRLRSHEFRHVYQHESAGSLAKFLPIYLRQIVAVGYYDAPLEIDARSHEIER